MEIDDEKTSKKHPNIFRFECKACAFSTTVPTEARRHVTAVHAQPSPQQCVVETCTVTCLTEKQRRAHLLRHDADDRLVECLFCHQQNHATAYTTDFTNTYEMKQHLCETHAMVVPTSRLSHAFPKLWFVCDSPEKTSDRTNNYGKWFRVVSVADNQPTEYDFTLHVRRNPAGNVQASCCLCSHRVCDVRRKSWSMLLHFNQHLKPLNKISPFVCWLGQKFRWCSSKFTTLHGLRRHLNLVHDLKFKLYDGLLIDRCF